MKKKLLRIHWKFLKKIGLTKKKVAIICGIEKIDRNQISLLEMMRKENVKSRSPFKASEIWIKLAKDFDDWFWWEGIGEIETQSMNNFFSSPSPSDPKLFRYACWMYYQELRERDTMDLLSKIPTQINPKSGISFEFNNTIVSWDKLISIDTFYTLAEINPAILTEPVVILDLGAGWGRMGYILKKANPMCTYIICDLPEALLVSSTYLPRLLPDEVIINFNETRNCLLNKKTFENGGIFFLGTQDLERIEDKSIDFFINIASFQEMTFVQVNEYFNLIDLKVRGHFFTQQLKQAQTHGYNLSEINGLTDYPFRPNWKSIFLRDSFFSDLYFETAYKISDV